MHQLLVSPDEAKKTKEKIGALSSKVICFTENGLPFSNLSSFVASQVKMLSEIQTRTGEVFEDYQPIIVEETILNMDRLKQAILSSVMKPNSKLNPELVSFGLPASVYKLIIRPIVNELMQCKSLPEEMQEICSQVFQMVQLRMKAQRMEDKHDPRLLTLALIKYIVDEGKLILT